MKPQNINIKIADREYKLKVSSPEEEELKRKAADEINRRLEARLKMGFRGVEIADHLSLIALELGVERFSAQETLETMLKESGQLHRDIESYLENIDK